MMIIIIIGVDVWLIESLTLLFLPAMHCRDIYLYLGVDILLKYNLCNASASFSTINSDFI